MIVGVDVYHDASRKGSSFAGIVSSMNDLATRYFSMVKEQKQGQEIMDALRVAFIESLIKYWEINRNWPSDIGKVLFYFKILLDAETALKYSFGQMVIAWWPKYALNELLFIL